MFKNKFPIFRKGNIISKLDLDLLRDNSLGFIKTFYSDYCDGIINGFDLIIEKDKIRVTKGILLYKNDFYVMNKDSFIDIPVEEDKYILKIKMSKKFEGRRYFLKEGEIILESGFSIRSNEIELGRFINRVGAILRNDYKNFLELKIDFNVIDIINRTHSTKEEKGTFHPTIMKLYACDVLKKDNISSVDKIFCLNCLNSLTYLMDRSMILGYIKCKSDYYEMNKDYDSLLSLTNYEIYEYLIEIIKNIGVERVKTVAKRRIPKKIIVD